MSNEPLVGQPTRAPSHPRPATPVGDLLYDAFFSGAVGGSVIAVFFLLIDSIGGRPLFTPSLIGTVLFTGIPAGAVAEVRLDMVAYFSAVHFVSFGGLGLAIALLCRWTGLTARHPAMIAGVIFAILTGVFFVGEAVAMPGIAGVIGVHWIVSANLLTGTSMALFLRWAHSFD